jgi:hypothetical protein
MRVLVACEFSGIVREAFKAKGHDAWSCDLLPTEILGKHNRGDVLEILDGLPVCPSCGNLCHQDHTSFFCITCHQLWPLSYTHTKAPWDLMIAHPPCTYLTVTANKWLKDQPERKSGALVGRARREAREQAIEFFTILHNCKIPKKVIENPVGCMSSILRKPDQIISPNDFGHKEEKKTCLWLEGLPLLVPTNRVEPEPRMILKSGKTMPEWYARPKLGKDRQDMRNRTFQGIANAMAEQWG